MNMTCSATDVASLFPEPAILSEVEFMMTTVGPELRSLIISRARERRAAFIDAVKTACG